VEAEADESRFRKEISLLTINNREQGWRGCLPRRILRPIIRMYDSIIRTIIRMYDSIIRTIIRTIIRMYDSIIRTIIRTIIHSGGEETAMARRTGESYRRSYDSIAGGTRSWRTPVTQGRRVTRDRVVKPTRVNVA
jgi:hypothetical protein